MRRQMRPFAGATSVWWRVQLLASLLFGCSDGGPTVTEGATSSISFDAPIEVAPLRIGYVTPVEAELRVQPFYMRRDGTRVQIDPVRIIPLQRAFAQSRRHSVPLDVTQCVRDTQRDGNEAGCPVALDIDLRMAGGGLLLDRQRLGTWDVPPLVDRLLTDSVRLLEVEYRGVAPQNPSIVVGATLQMRTIFTTTRGDTVRRAVIWAIGNSATARIDSTGIVTGLSPGRTFVTAGYGDGQSVNGTEVTVRLP